MFINKVILTLIGLQVLASKSLYLLTDFDQTWHVLYIDK